LNITNQENEKLKAHYSFICKYSEKMNLMSRSEIEKGYNFFYQNHVLDALRPIDLNIAWTKAKIVDVGSGSGIPGIPLAIVLGDIVDTVALVEATGKKAGFLEHVIKKLDLSKVKVINERAEDIGSNSEFRGHFDVAVTRAVGYIDECMEITLPLLQIQGLSILYRGEISSDEALLSTKVANNLGGKVEQIVDYSLPGIDKTRNLLVIRKTDVTHEKYPRPPGKPKKHSIFKKIS